MTHTSEPAREAVLAEIKEYTPAGGESVMIWVNNRDTRRGGYCLECVPRHVAPVVAAALCASPAPAAGGLEAVARIELPSDRELPPLTDRGLLGQLMDAAWPLYGGNNQPPEFWYDFEEGLRFAAHYLASPAATRGETQSGDGGREAVAFPAYGELPFDELGAAVKAAQFGAPEPYEFDPEFYPGHQVFGPINFNSLNRIVTWFVKRAALATAEG